MADPVKVKVFVVTADKTEIGVAPTALAADQILKTYKNTNPEADVTVGTDDRVPDPAWESEVEAV